MWSVFPIFTLSYAWLGGGFSSYGSPTRVYGAFMRECIQPAKGLFISEAGRDVCWDGTMNGIPACINLYYIITRCLYGSRTLFGQGKRDPGLFIWKQNAFRPGQAGSRFVETGTGWKAGWFWCIEIHDYRCMLKRTFKHQLLQKIS
jgi:hypothetical protein